MPAACDVPVWDSAFRTPCCDATTTISTAFDGDDGVLVCRGCYAEVVHDDGGALLGVAR